MTREIVSVISQEELWRMLKMREKYVYPTLDKKISEEALQEL